MVVPTVAAALCLPDGCHVAVQVDVTADTNCITEFPLTLAELASMASKLECILPADRGLLHGLPVSLKVGRYRYPTAYQHLAALAQFFGPFGLASGNPGCM